MIRALLIGLSLASTTPVLAAAPTAGSGQADEPAFSSAAVAGVFKALPPTGTGYPIEMLLKIRERLGGEPVPAESTEPEADDH
ncbi:hypothetical protein [Marinovum sp.]|uniref:hypothetical protein n=1 Tax=Marinovum sp. TaxID=2024839 RepID=UPI002B27056B|nr:hypothetical protein [Marinovum sp.]